MGKKTSQTQVILLTYVLLYKNAYYMWVFYLHCFLAFVHSVCARLPQGGGTTAHMLLLQL